MRLTDPRCRALFVWTAAIAFVLLAGAPGIVARASYSPPVVKLSVESLGFGKIPSGDSATRNVTIKNEGATEIRVTKFTGSPEFTTFPVVPFTIRAGGSATVVLTCTGAEPRNIAESSTFTFENPTAEQSTASLGLVAIISALKFEVAEVDFGEVEVGDTADKVVLVKNVSKKKIKFQMQAPNQPFTIGTGLKTLDPGEETVVTVNFSPKDVRFYFSVSDAKFFKPKRFPVITLPMSGKGIKKVSLAPSRLDFGTVRRNVIHTRTLSLSNLTDQPQPVSLGAKLDPEYFTVRPFGRMILAPMARIDVQVQFGARGRCRHRGKLTLRDAAGVLRAAIPVAVAAR